LIFRSTKKQAQEFQDWVYEDVLTALRRHGTYGMSSADQTDKLQVWLNGDLQVALKKREEERDQALVGRMENRLAQLEAALDAALARRDDRVLARLAQQCEQLGLRVVFAMQGATTRGLSALLQPLAAGMQGLSHNVSMKVRGAVKDVIDAAVTSTDSSLVRAFRSATKGPARRTTIDPKEVPEDQQADEVQQGLESLGLAEVAHELCPAMTYSGWKAVRGLFGKACLTERKRRGRLALCHSEHIAQPLLWTFSGGRTNQGGGVRRLYLKSQKELICGVWKKSSRTQPSFHQRAEKASLDGPDEPWPVHAADLELPDFTFSAA
jgi:hypothetical protein